MHTWSWQVWQEATYLTCSLLEELPHGFFTRQSWPQAPSELTLALHPQAKVCRVQQVHGNQVLSASVALNHQSQQTEASAEAIFAAADGLYSDGPHQAVWVCSADCTPVLIADIRTKQVAAVHAGWRGTAARIVPEAIAKMQTSGSSVKDLKVVMGPAIAGEVYQVSSEVAAEVGRSLLDPVILSISDHPLTDDQVVQTLMQGLNPPLLADPKPGHVRLDVRRVNALQLQKLGLEPDQIAIAPHCTYQDPDRFFSYRRDNRRQVQWSGIVSGVA